MLTGGGSLLATRKKRVITKLASRNSNFVLFALYLLCFVMLNLIYWKKWSKVDSFSFFENKIQFLSKAENGTYAKDNGTNSNPCSDNDCMQLQNRLKRWPNGKPKAFVYYLIQFKRFLQLQRSLKSLDQYFNDMFHYPVVIFYEWNFLSPILCAVIRQFSNSDLYFQAITFETPYYPSHKLKQFSCPTPTGYRHMCRFHSKLVYQQPVIHGFEYAWRLDDDSAIYQAVKYDIFVYMKRNHLQYGYAIVNDDRPDCSVNLWESAETYMGNSSITPTFFNEWEKYRVYYNNFEVSRLSLWLSDSYRNFIDYIDELGGIYHYRWGDAAIKTIAVSMFVPKHETHHFKDVKYEHAGITDF